MNIYDVQGSHKKFIEIGVKASLCLGLRARKPRRTDADLCAVYDGIRDYDALRYIALLATVIPKHTYELRPRRRLMTVGDRTRNVDHT